MFVVKCPILTHADKKNTVSLLNSVRVETDWINLVSIFQIFFFSKRIFYTVLYLYLLNLNNEECSKIRASVLRLNFRFSYWY